MTKNQTNSILFISPKRVFIARFMLTIFLVNIFLSPSAFALTSGPSQPEVQTFTPVGTSDMVDLFTGDFNYNLPLLDVGGYPINLSYMAGVSPDMEASWTGLGWNINPGVITRNLRGLPDDFKGDNVKKEFNMRPTVNVGVTGSFNGELFGVKLLKMLGLKLGLGVTYNNYSGFAFETNVTPSLSIGDKSKDHMNLNLGLSVGSEGSLGINPSVSFTDNQKLGSSYRDVTGSIGVSMNTAEGYKGMSIGMSVRQYQMNKTEVDVIKDGKPDTEIVESQGKLTGEHNGGSHYSYAAPSFTPEIKFPTISTSLALGVTFGGALFGAHGNYNIVGYWSKQELEVSEMQMAAYGYLYSDQAGHGSALMDFNREKDGPVSPETSNLPVTVPTYDLYSVYGQGIGGMYRPFRSDVGNYRDNKQYNSSTDLGTLGIEIGAGNAVHGGVDYDFSMTNGESGEWSSGNNFINQLAFRDSRQNFINSPNFESFYFKQAGEKNVSTNMEHFHNTGGFEAIAPILSGQSVGKSYISSAYEKKTVDASKSLKINRENRNQNFSMLNAKQASNVAVSPKIEVYSQSNFDYSNKKFVASENINRAEGYRRGHHISQISATKPDGSRYVYGIPMYNTKQIDATFNVAENVEENENVDGMVGYSDRENSTGNKSGVNHYYEKVETGPYAHGYMLSYILSADYMDADKIPGPSDGDLGTYTKFNYSKLAALSKWRVPFQEKKANYIEGMRSASGPYNRDDKGSFNYGEKEIWYLHSIETKSHIAQFYLSEREDGYGVKGENGGKDADQKLLKLDKIELYAKAEKIRAAAVSSNGKPAVPAVPLKVVHFEYDYSLLAPSPDGGKETYLPNSKYDAAPLPIDPEHPKSKGGKLTLKKVYFTYGASEKGRLNSYKFAYSHCGTKRGLYNPVYNPKSVDRWGSYRSFSDLDVKKAPYTAEVPYAEQDDEIANRDAGVWNLSEINLPSGSVIKVNYEADDYAYVQDKKAMQMIQVTGAGSSSTSDVNNVSLMSDCKGGANNYLFFKLPEKVPYEVGRQKLYVKQHYIGDMTFLAFRFLVNVFTSEEFISGYAEIENYGLVPTESNYSTHGFVKVKASGMGMRDGGGDANPISKATWQFLQLYNPSVMDIGAGTKPPTESSSEILEAFESFARGSIRLLAAPAVVAIGFNRFMCKLDMGKRFKSSRSFIRLINPDGKKKGGGYRVNKIEISDQWKELTGESDKYENATYGQTFDYTMTEDFYSTKRQISSGVAAYEPLIGNEENPFRQPVFQEKKATFLAPKRSFYMEEPFGESFFPAPTIGYRQVTVRNLNGASLTPNATGKSVHEFYTSYDYPTVTKQVAIQKDRDKPKDVGSFLKLRNRDFLAASQGYLVELNDMHGKPKSEKVYAEGKYEAPLSGVEYKYKNLEDKRLSNYSDVAYKYGEKGLIKQALVGLDYEIAIDTRQSKNNVIGGGLHGNLEAFLAAVIPMAIPIPIPSIRNEKTRLRSIVVTKIIQHYGLVEKTIAYDHSSEITTENLLRDAETGEVLLTKTTNQFDDPVYNFTYPAHWAYDRMGGAYKNSTFHGTVDLGNTPYAGYFALGDEMAVYNTDNSFRTWAIITDKTSNSITLTDKQGKDVEAGVYILFTIRSGNRNMQSLPVGTVTTLANPLYDSNGDGKPDLLSFTKVLNANAVEYDEDWKIYCNCQADPDFKNPYVIGKKGNWRPKRSYLYLTGRNQSMKNDNVNIRKDGAFTGFTPFWLYPNASGNNWSKDPGSWTFTSEVTLFGRNGNELENKDALKRYSASTYGYNDLLPTAAANNSKLKDMAFDNFEDYDFSNCEDDHFSYKKNKDNISKLESHTGRRSIKIPRMSQLDLKKVIEKCD